jgi:glycosyltransferase involved in cell wall biosynthesis
MTRSDRRPRILYACGREANYVRNRLLIRGLIAHSDVTILASERRGYPGRFAQIFPRLFRASRDVDLIVAGFLGQPLALFAARVLRKPVLLDAMISLYDTLCFDRRTTSPTSVLGRLAFALDQQSISASRLTLVDTAAHGRFFAQTLGLPPGRLFVHYVGPDFDLCSVVTAPSQSHVLDVVHYSSYLPLHGVDVVVKAAAMLRSEPGIRVRLVGAGPELPRVRALTEREGLPNVEFIPWLPLAELSHTINNAGIALGGHFADNPKARRVIAGKTFQFLAAGRPTIVGDNPANRELFTPGRHVEAIPHADPASLALAIRRLAADEEHRAFLGRSAGSLVREVFDPSAVATNLRHAVELALEPSRD